MPSGAKSPPPAPVQLHLAANLRRLRKARALTQDGLAELLSLSPRYVRSLESGSVNVDLRRLQAIADGLGVEPASLLRPAKLAPPRVGRPPGRSRRP